MFVVGEKAADDDVMRTSKRDWFAAVSLIIEHVARQSPSFDRVNPPVAVESISKPCTRRAPFAKIQMTTT